LGWNVQRSFGGGKKPDPGGVTLEQKESEG